MLIRSGGYNTGAQEYLEEGRKSGREFTRDELDHRMIIDGQLSLTRAIYESIPDHGQDRYLTFTMSFKEDTVSPEMLKAVTAEFKQFLMHAYKAEEFNFYAEAHLPKMKTILDQKTGELIDRKPHIHVIVPRINLMSGNEANPVDIYNNHIKYFEAFQEYINQKYQLASPRDNVRADITDAASVLSRYKGDDFYGKNREFKQGLVKQVIERDVRTREDFYALVAEHGETRIRNKGKESEYISVKLPGDARGTNLKDTIFQDDFIVRRELKKPPLEPWLIDQRLQEWPQRSKEIKYVNKATPAFRKKYSEASPEERVGLLAKREQKFYLTYENQHDDSPVTSSRDHQRGPAEASIPRRIEATPGMQDMSVSDVADHGQAGSAGKGDGPLLLPGHAHVHLGQQEPGGDSGLRSPVRTGRGARGRPTEAGRPGRPAAVSAETAGDGKHLVAGPSRRLTAEYLAAFPFPAHVLNPNKIPTIEEIEARGRRLFGPTKVEGEESHTAPPAAGSRRSKGGSPAGPGSPGNKRWRIASDPRPVYARNPHRVAGVADIEARAKRLFGPLKGPVEHALVIKLPSIKPLLVNRQASTVAAYFTRQAEQNQLKPAQRRVLRRINKQFFDLRRQVFSDQRLTRHDKAQLVSVLTFERLKAQEAIHNPQHNQEVVLMGSAEIRKLYVEEDDPGFSISGPSGLGIDRAAPAGVRSRVQRVLDTLSRQLDPKVQTERERELNAKDLYTRKSKFSQNVHYLDKTTNKTLFVDTGKAIAMRRTGITENGVAVALQLAKERFGSTLTINGTAEFKQLVIEAAAKNGLDVHFTDKDMNQSLAARRAELEIGQEGQAIAQPSAVDLKVVQSVQFNAAQAAAAATVVTRVVSPANAEEPAAQAVPLDNWAVAMNRASANHQEFQQEFRTEDHSQMMAAMDIGAVATLQKVGYGPEDVLHEDKTDALTQLLGRAQLTMDSNPAYRYYMEDHAPERLLKQIQSAVPLPNQKASANPQTIAATSEQATAESTETSAEPAARAIKFDNWAVAVNQAQRTHMHFGLEQRPVEYSQVMAATDIAAVAALEDVGYGPDAVQHEDKTDFLKTLLGRAQLTMEENPAYRSYMEAHAPKELIDQIRAAVPESYQKASANPQADVLESVASTNSTKVQGPGPAPLQFTHNGQPATLNLSQYQQPVAPPAQPSTPSYVVTEGPSELAQMDAKWRESLGLSEQDIAGSATAMQVRGENHANWLVATLDNTPEAVSMISTLMENDSYRESFKDGMQDLYVFANDHAPQDIPAMDAVTGFAENLVNKIEGRSAEESAPAPARGDDRKTIKGELVDHGAAPYLHNEKLRDKPLSYFVKLHTEAGLREVWGVALADVMKGDAAPYQVGDQILLKDLGKVPVIVPEVQADGSIKQIETERREWAGELLAPAQAVAESKPATVVPTTVDHAEAEQDQGMSTD
jgi:hypothetical protein